MTFWANFCVQICLESDHC
ncbi:hypothetical protein Taro_048680 [Colocasia esculenta]|uniref:Uncharacterized protein n=1 Tax=Colocasia esculenta TaxID=4460 RepID=A0A843X8W6_COLES|nr:hypothetical protein [Colocasia esculenta]